MRLLFPFLLGAASMAAALLAPDAALGQSLPTERGRAIAARECARCHAIGRTGDSPFGLAPPFRELSQRYALEALAEALAEGIVTGHPAMPRFTFHPREIDALLSYIGSLAPQQPPMQQRTR